MLPQKMHAGSYFFRTIVSSFTKISTASRLPRLRFLRISIGSTIHPNSSILLTIPVDFMIAKPPVKFKMFLWDGFSIPCGVIFVNKCKKFF